MASASPKANETDVLAVGASPKGQASLETSALICISLSFANSEEELPDMPIILAPILLMVGKIDIISSLFPELEKNMTISSLVIIPRSP